MAAEREDIGEIMTLVDLERWHIVNVLAWVDGNISAAARHLGIYRSSLQRKMRKHGLRR